MPLRKTSSASATDPQPSRFQQISRHPVQLRLNASTAESRRPNMVDGVNEKRDDDGGAICFCGTSARTRLQSSSPTLRDCRSFRRLTASASANWVSAYIFRNSSTAARLSTVRWRVLKSATTSDRCSRSGLTFGLVNWSASTTGQKDQPTSRPSRRARTGF